MNKQPIVFIIDDDPLIGQAITWLLETVNMKTKVFVNAQSFIEQYTPNCHGCILLDVRMPGMGGLELQEYLNAHYNPLPVIMISGHGDVPMAVRAMKAGAQDFILKPFNDQVLLEKIQAAIVKDSQREQTFSPHIAAKCFSLLTPRERQVMRYVVDGKLNKEIAYELNISLSTVEMHRANVMEKMQVKSLADLVKMALLLDSVTENK